MPKARRVRLSGGRYAFVDARDYSRVRAFRWYLLSGRYACATVGRRKVLMHVLISGQSWPDHRDGNGLNNRRRNLRPGSGGRNQQNARLRWNSTTGYKGVYLDRRTGRYYAQIKFQRHVLSLGTFGAAADAAHAYDAAARRLFGVYGRFNCPKKGERGVRK